jgi:hypothetical protein
MNGFKYIALTAVAGLSFLATSARPAQAQISVDIGTPPACPYGYYEAPPYTCAPEGYYGPEWYTGGVFIGAGPWFHGPANFHGNVNNHFHPDHGYHGAMPNRGEAAHAGWNGSAAHFKGNEVHDGHGHVGGHR